MTRWMPHRQVFDEPHPADVGREVVHLGRSAAGLRAGVPVLEVGAEVLYRVESLKPLIERLDVHGPDVCVTTPEQVRDQVTADEAACARDQDSLFRHRIRLREGLWFCRKGQESLT